MSHWRIMISSALLLVAVSTGIPAPVAWQQSNTNVTLFVAGMFSQCDGTDTCQAVSDARPIWQTLYGAGTSRPATFHIFSYSGTYAATGLPIYSPGDTSTNARLYSTNAPLPNGGSTSSSGTAGLADVIFPAFLDSMIARYPQASIDIVGFSLGGVVATEWARWASIHRPTDLSKVRTIVLLDSPVGGVNPALIAQFGCLLPQYGFCTGVVNDIRWDAPLTNNRLAWIPSGRHPPLVCLESTDDYVVNGVGYPAAPDMPLGRGCWVSPSGQTGVLSAGFDPRSARWPLGFSYSCLPSDGLPCFLGDVVERHGRILRPDSYPDVRDKLLSILGGPAAATLSGTVSLQGLTPGTSSYQVALEVRLFRPGTTDPVGTIQVTTDVSGSFSVSGIVPGTYDVEVKEARRLGRIARELTLTAGVNGKAFGALLAGDVNGDDSVSLADYSRLRASYGKCQGDAGYVPEADFTGDGCVGLPDYTRLRANYGVTGPLPAP